MLRYEKKEWSRDRGAEGASVYVCACMIRIDEVMTKVGAVLLFVEDRQANNFEIDHRIMM